MRIENSIIPMVVENVEQINETIMGKTSSRFTDEISKRLEEQREAAKKEQTQTVPQTSVPSVKTSLAMQYFILESLSKKKNDNAKKEEK